MYIDDIKKIKSSDLENGATLKLIKKAVAFCIVNQQYGEARAIRVLLKNLYQQAASALTPVVRQSYEEQLLRLIFFNIVVISNEEFSALLRAQLIKALKWGHPVLARLNEYIDYHHDYYFNFSSAQQFLQAVRDNAEMIGGKAIKQWLKEYASNAGQQAPRDSLKRITFLNQNTASLSAAERELLLKALEIFDWLSYPTPEEGGEVQVGIQPNSVFAQAIESAIKEKIKEPLKAVNLKIIWDEVSGYLSSQGEYEAAADFYLTIPTPAALKSFLRVWLVEFEQKSEQLALQVALRVANTLKKAGYSDYMAMVYLDQQDEKLHWQE